MKKILLTFIIFCAVICLAVGCDKNNQKQKVLIMNEKTSINDANVIVENDIENERFVVSYTKNNNVIDTFFSFELTLNGECLWSTDNATKDNKVELSVTTKDEKEISYDSIKEEVTIYVSYASLDENLKTSLKNYGDSSNNYSIYVNNFVVIKTN